MFDLINPSIHSLFSTCFLSPSFRFPWKIPLENCPIFRSFCLLSCITNSRYTPKHFGLYQPVFEYSMGEGWRGIDAPSMWILAENLRTMYLPTPEILSSLCMEKVYVGPTTLICHQPPTKILNWIFLHIHILTCHQECVTQTHFLEIEKYLCDPNCERSKIFLFLFLKFFQDYLLARSFDTFLFLQIIPLDRNNGIGKNCCRFGIIWC